MDKRLKKGADQAMIQDRAQFYADLDSGKMTVSEATRRMRKLAKLTQPEYAALVNVAPRVLIDLERAVGNPTLDTLTKIGRPFGLTVTFAPRTSVTEHT